jgi:hypothetical protein
METRLGKRKRTQDKEGGAGIETRSSRKRNSPQNVLSSSTGTQSELNKKRKRVAVPAVSIEESRQDRPDQQVARPSQAKSPQQTEQLVSGGHADLRQSNRKVELGRSMAARGKQRGDPASSGRDDQVCHFLEHLMGH